MRRWIWGMGSALALSGCGQMMGGEEPPELVCLERIDADMQEYAEMQPQTVAEGIEYLNSIVELIDDIDREGCSDETRDNLDAMRDSAAQSAVFVERYQNEAPPPEEAQAAQAVAQDMITAGDAIDAELLRRRRDHEGG